MDGAQKWLDRNGKTIVSSDDGLGFLKFCKWMAYITVIPKVVATAPLRCIQFDYSK